MIDLIKKGHFYPLYQQNKSSESKGKFRQASNHCKGFLRLPNLHVLKEQKTPWLLRNLYFWWIANSVNKTKSAVPPLFKCSEVLSSASDKAKFFAKNFSKNSNLDDSGICLPIFPETSYFCNSQDGWKGHNESWFIKGIWSWLYSRVGSKELWAWTFILAELFSMCLKEFCFLDCWKVSSVVPVFKNVRERSTDKNYSLSVFFLWLVKSNFVNNRIVDHQEK